MPRLTWNASGERYYETGVDRGVLYVDTQNGVAWTGLISVSEAPTGGEAKPYYLDGIKYLNVAAAEEFEATISAFGSPAEFAPCDGVASVQNGLFVTEQPRKPFNLSYRTKVGNDTSGSDYAYKIHLIYNALAAPSDRDNKTMGGSSDPTSLSWVITTLPPKISGYKPTAHFVIDSRFTRSDLLIAIEDILYGNDSAAPRIPSVTELMGIFASYLPLKVFSIEANVYEIHEVDTLDGRAVMQSTSPPTPSITEEPILWLDTSGGNYAVPKLVTGG